MSTLIGDGKSRTKDRDVDLKKPETAISGVVREMSFLEISIEDLENIQYTLSNSFWRFKLTIA